MKLIEPKHKNAQKGNLQKLVDQISQLLPFGKTDVHAEDTIIQRFQRGLDNRFIMLHNLRFESDAPPFPPILVGPMGLFVFNLSKEGGFFKAKEDSWWKMDQSTHRFNPWRPNLIKQSQEYAKKLANLLDGRGKSHPEIVPVLIFANQGVHVETTNPAIRIVRMDGVDNMIATLLNSEVVLQSNEINYLSDSLEFLADPDKAIPLGEGEDFFGQDLLVPEEKAPPKAPSIKVPTDMPLPAVEEKLQFTKKQWTILIVLLSSTIVILLGAIIFVLISL